MKASFVTTPTLLKQTYQTEYTAVLANRFVRYLCMLWLWLCRHFPGRGQIGSVTLNSGDASTWPARSGRCCICLRPSVRTEGSSFHQAVSVGGEELLQRSSRVLELECICVESGEGGYPYQHVPTAGTYASQGEQQRDEG